MHPVNLPPKALPSRDSYRLHELLIRDSVHKKLGPTGSFESFSSKFDAASNVPTFKLNNRKSMKEMLLSYWWIGLIVICLILYKFILRFLFGMVIVPEDRIGLVTKKFVLFGQKGSSNELLARSSNELLQKLR